MDIPNPSDVNITAVAVATVVVLLLALAWYRPRLSIYTKREVAVAVVLTVALAFFSVLTIAVNAVAHTPHYWDPVNGRMNSWTYGLQGGDFEWGAWVLPVLVGLTVWGERSWKSFARDAAFFLVALLLSGAILAQW